MLTAYRALWEARTRTYAKAELDPAVARHAANTALSNVKLTLAYYQDHGTVMRGTPRIAPKVTAVNTTAKPAKAVLTDCVDTRDYTEVNRKTGKKVPVGDGPRRHVYNATAVRVDGSWRIWTTTIERDRTC
ncbi:hypothetical protein GCM10012285_61530 [Streptomyces kronopolitis]|uniref:Secreted protein/lipoprotein n=1 Tax=Streptomyces kronopolitis TaxID=1612435 RepID=A0ABQ2K1G3_9ACTN|nr:hypothetical protein [Streptomyces kronopolitis]GGN61948.1 hypothetical protein GCM10012285_61530 [Streptomyces kronopolitis]